MPTMDIFNSDAFTMQEMTDNINKVPFQPGFLGSMNLFRTRPIRTESFSMEEKEGHITLIQTSNRGAPIEQQESRKRKMRNFTTLRIAKGDNINAGEIQGVRAYGSMTEMQQVQDVVNERNEWLLADLEFTRENMRMGAVQGIVTDADGSTLTDWFSEFGITQPTEIDFDLDASSPSRMALHQVCTDMKRSMLRDLKIGQMAGLQIVGLADDTFFDLLMKHNDVYQVEKQSADAGDLSAAKRLERSMEFGEVVFAGIRFINYRSTDNINDSPATNKKLQIPAGTCKFFPVNVPGLFQVVQSPAESFEFVNTPGQPLYSMMIRDRDRNMWVKPEIYSYPLYMCTRPEVLYRGRST